MKTATACVGLFICTVSINAEAAVSDAVQAATAELQKSTAEKPLRIALSPEEQSWLAAHPRIRWVGDPARAPLMFEDSDHKPIGITSDYMDEIGRRLGVEFHYVSTSNFTQALDLATARSADLIAPLADTPEREKLFILSEPLFAFRSVVMAREGEKPFTLLEELDGRRWALVKGFNETKLLRELLPHIEVVETANTEEAVEALSLHQADFTAGNNAVLTYAARARGISNLVALGPASEGQRTQHIAIRRDWPVFAALVERALKSISESDRSRMLERWYSAADTGTLGNALLNDQDRSWIAAHRSIRIGGDPDWPPIDFVDSTGRHSGMAADFLQLLGRKLGLQFDYQYGLSWLQALRGVQGGSQLDLITSIGITPERQDFLNFTHAYLKFQSVVVTRADAHYGRDLAAMHDRQFVVPAGYTETQMLVQRYPELRARLREVPDPGAALREVALGRADATIGNIAVLQYLIVDGGYTNLKVAAPAFEDKIQMYFGVRKDWPQLVAILDKGIDAITPAEHDAILARWHTVEVEPGLDSRKVLGWVLTVALPMLALIFFIGYWAYRMRREVRARQQAETDLREVQLQLQQTLQRTSSHLNAIMENAPAAIWAKDEYGVFLFANRMYHEMFDVPMDTTIIGRTDYDFFPAEAAVSHQENDRRVREGGQTERFIESNRRKGVVQTVMSTKFPLLDETGRANASGGICLDISEQQRLQDELLRINDDLEQRVAARTREADEARRRVVDITDGIPGIVFEFERNHEGRYAAKFVSGGMENLTGIAADDTMAHIGRYFGVILPEDTGGYLAAIEDSARQCTEHRYDFRVRHARTGEIRWMQVHAETPRISDGCANWRGYLHDITAQKNLENELAAARDAAQAAGRAKADFLANMSHEIRTPMNAIIGMSHLALQTELSAKQRNYIGKIDNAAKSLLGIVNDILDFSKIEAGKLTIEQIDFSLQSVLDNLTTLVAQKAQEKGLEFLFDLDAALPDALIGDPLRLGQVLTNFCSNAVKFTEQGEIVVSVQILQRDTDRAQVRFAVRDTGIGLSEAQRNKLFQAFQQADTSITRKYGGTGLGLTISKRIVEGMGGTVGVDSEPGQGSTFWFTAELGIQGSPQAASAVSAGDIEGRRVLVADDNPTAREILVALARSLRMEVSAVASGSEAVSEVAAATDKPFDFVLMDWRMPGLSGAEAARAIKSVAGIAKPPAVIMVTAYGRDDVINELDGLKVEGVLTKPVNPSIMLNTMLGALGKEAALAQVTQQQNALPGVLLRGRRVLLVEDNEINQEVASEILQREGVHVTIANHGREALQRIAEHAYDVVLMDMQMPVMDGIEATREIRKHPEHLRLPIIAMTANVMRADIDNCILAGMNDHIGKPIDVKELLGTLAKWMTPVASTPANSASPAREHSEDLPESLAGIDLVQGLRNMAGSRSLYRKILLKFRDTQMDAAQRISAALAAGDSETAVRDAHTLRGLAGSIAAGSLQNAATALEKAIRQGDAEAGVHLEEVAVLLSGVIFAIAPLDARSEPVILQERRGRGAVTNFELLRKSLKELKQRLDEDDTSATELVESLSSNAFETGHVALLKELGAAVERYDFDGAKEYLSRLENSLEIGIPLES